LLYFDIYTGLGQKVTHAGNWLSKCYVGVAKIKYIVADAMHRVCYYRDTASHGQSAVHMQTRLLVSIELRKNKMLLQSLTHNVLVVFILHFTGHIF
jgi:hypothetical protein